MTVQVLSACRADNDCAGAECVHADNDCADAECVQG